MKFFTGANEFQRCLADSILALEFTNFCNCRCVMCTQGVDDGSYIRSRGFMDMSILKSVLDQAADCGMKFSKVLPFGLGESLLHPQFAEMFGYLCGRKRNGDLFGSLDLHTNGRMLDSENFDVILENAGFIDTLSFSVDAATEETYASIKGVQGLARVEENIMRLVKSRSRIDGRMAPKIHIQFIVMESNRNEAAAFLGKWADFLKSAGSDFQVNFDWNPPMRKDTIFFKRVNPFDRESLSWAARLHGSVRDELVSDPGFRKYFLPLADYGGKILPDEPSDASVVKFDNLAKLNNSSEYDGITPGKTRMACSGPFKFLNITWDGKVGVCCLDTEREIVIGDLSKQSLKDVWFGARAHSVRMAHIDGKLESVPKCAACRNMDSPAVTLAELDEYRRWAAKEGFFLGI